MSERTRPPFRADHVGSLLRPPELVQARAARAEGLIDDDELRAREDDAIRSALAMQRDVGLLSATDGEFRRAFWNMDFLWSLGGVVREAESRIKIQFRNETGDVDFQAPTAVVDGPVTLERTIFADHFAFVRDNVDDGITPKLTIPSPSTIFRGGRRLVPESVYPDLDEFWSDIEEAYSREIDGLYELGCRYLQLDDTALAFLTDPEHRQQLAENGGDPERQLGTYVEAINRVLDGRPDDLTVTVHICRGNHASSWQATGGYEPIAEAVFSDLAVDGFFLEYDDDRSGSFEPLRFMPAGKQVVLGLVTSKRPELESKDVLKSRIEEASRYVPLDQLSLSPQCGFASTEEGNKLTGDQQRAKLSLVVETANEVWN